MPRRPCHAEPGLCIPTFTLQSLLPLTHQLVNKLRNHSSSPVAPHQTAHLACESEGLCRDCSVGELGLSVFLCVCSPFLTALRASQGQGLCLFFLLQLVWQGNFAFSQQGIADHLAD